MKAHKKKKLINESNMINNKNHKACWARIKRDGYYSISRDKMNRKFWSPDYDSDDTDDWFLGFNEILEILKQRK